MKDGKRAKERKEKERLPLNGKGERFDMFPIVCATSLFFCRARFRLSTALNRNSITFNLPNTLSLVLLLFLVSLRCLSFALLSSELNLF